MLEQFAKLAPEVSGKDIFAIDMSGTSGDLLAGERPHGVAQHVDGVAEIDVQAEWAHVWPILWEIESQRRHFSGQADGKDNQ
jgi:hypothetical protein